MMGGGVTVDQNGSTETRSAAPPLRGGGTDVRGNAIRHATPWPAAQQAEFIDARGGLTASWI